MRLRGAAIACQTALIWACEDFATAQRLMLVRIDRQSPASQPA